MQQLFHVSQQGIGVKQQICLVVQLIVRTVHQIHAVFYTAENDTLNIDTNGMLTLLSTKLTYYLYKTKYFLFCFYACVCVMRWIKLDGHLIFNDKQI